MMNHLDKLEERFKPAENDPTLMQPEEQTTENVENDDKAPFG